MCLSCERGGSRPEGEGVETEAGPFLLVRRTMLKVGVGFVAWPVMQFLQACATTGAASASRPRSRLISDEEEAKIGMTAFQQLHERELRRGRLVTERDDPAAYAWVKRVTDRVISASGLADKHRWEYVLIYAPETANAIAFPGGRIIVYTGILPLAQDDAGLAAIIGHVVGHVMSHHMGKRISREMGINLLEALTSATGATDSTRVVMREAGKGLLARDSQTYEAEADYIGLLLMAKAGYDPRESVALWERMSPSTGESERGNEFLSTHSNPQMRVSDLQTWMPQALEYYQNPNLPLPELK